MRKMGVVLVTILCLVLSSSLPADSCTVFRLKADDGTIIVGRSMEFAVDMKYDVIVVPRNKSYVSPAPDGKEGLAWEAQYGYIGMAAFGMDYGISDGMNEAGLAVGMLWFEQLQMLRTRACSH